MRIVRWLDCNVGAKSQRQSGGSDRTSKVRGGEHHAERRDRDCRVRTKPDTPTGYPAQLPSDDGCPGEEEDTTLPARRYSWLRLSSLLRVLAHTWALDKTANTQPLSA